MKRPFKIVSGDTLALTPPMGWNHWYAHYDRVTDKLIREAADSVIRNGMADVGYQYINIDDCWMNAEKNRDPLRVGPLRDADGRMLSNQHFPDMKALTDYIHRQGLKAGIYSSPGPTTCAGFCGSYEHEAQDAKQFADWGFDFLKYDWCSFDQVVNKVRSLENLQKPYVLMGALLQQQNRDIVLKPKAYAWAMCGNGGRKWRPQLAHGRGPGYELNRIFQVALANAKHRAWSRPAAE